MIEDNTEDFIIFDIDRSNTLRFVKDVFKNLIGQF